MYILAEVKANTLHRFLIAIKSSICFLAKIVIKIRLPPKHTQICRRSRVLLRSPNIRTGERELLSPVMLLINVSRSFSLGKKIFLISSLENDSAFGNSSTGTCIRWADFQSLQQGIPTPVLAFSYASFEAWSNVSVCRSHPQRGLPGFSCSSYSCM